MFGEENVEWVSKNRLSDSDRIRIKNWDYKPCDELYLKYKDVYQNDLYYNQATGKINWPINDGFDSFTDDINLKAGVRIDRYGFEGGTGAGIPEATINPPLPREYVTKPIY